MTTRNRCYRTVCACLAAIASTYGAAINYDITKNYTFTTNANVVPTLNEQRYAHSYDYNVNGGGIAVNTAQNNNAYDAFAIDTYNANWPNAANANIYYWALFNRPSGHVPVAITKETVNGLTLAGSPYNDAANAGGASANVNATVTTLQAKQADGTLDVNGSIPDPAAGERLFAMSYGQITARANGANLAGVITNNANMRINNLAAPRGIGSTQMKTGAADPVAVAAFDSSGNMLSDMLLMVSQGEVDGWGFLDWSSNSLDVNADNAMFTLSEFPFSSGDPSGTLTLTIVNDVVSFSTTGTAFLSCQATKVVSSGSFSCTLPTTASFNYSYNSNGNMMTVEADSDSVGFTQASNAPEPGTMLSVGLGLVCGARLWRRRSSRG